MLKTRLFALSLSLILLPLSIIHAAPAQSIGVQAAFQQFDTGFMVWRSDTGLIWVFADDGHIYSFDAINYGRLPENPVRAYTPAQHYRPILGFGKVWGNFAYVRNAIGWATGPEQSYTMQLDQSGDFYLFTITLPDNRVMAVNGNSRWQTDGMVPTISYAAFQAFDNGYMIWRADNQEVTVFIGRNNGSLQGYAIGSYDYLPDNPVTDNPPAGHVKAINAFGRIWGHDAALRGQIGWPTAPEQGYTTTMQATADGHFTMSTPDGRIFNINSVYWAF